MASPPPLSSNPLGRDLVESQWIEFAIVTLVMLARLYTRLFIKRIFGADDYLMLTAYFVTLCAFVLNNLAVNAGFGVHASQLDPSLVSEAVKWAFIGQVFGLLASAFARMAFIATLAALLAPTQKVQLWLLRTFFFFQVTVNAMTALYILLQCRPTEGLWDHSVDAQCLPPSIQSDIGFFQGSVSALTDLSLAIFPATIIWKLNMKLSLKISLCATMGLGVFAFATAVIKTRFLADISSTPDDLTWALWKIQFWFCIEDSLLIIAGTIPVLRPLLTRRNKGSYIGSDDGDGDDHSTFVGSHHHLPLRDVRTEVELKDPMTCKTQTSYPHQVELIRGKRDLGSDDTLRPTGNYDPC